MKKWENTLILKNYNNKIKNAKPILKTSSQSKVPSRVLTDVKININKPVKTPTIGQNYKRNIESASSQKTLISDYYDFEKSDLARIPLYRLLRINNLQQYSKELISRGFGYDLQKFLFLSKNELDILFQEIKVLPGHQTKLLKLIDYIRNLFFSFEGSNNSSRKEESLERTKSVNSMMTEDKILSKKKAPSYDEIAPNSMSNAKKAIIRKNSHLVDKESIDLYTKKENDIKIKKETTSLNKLPSSRKSLKKSIPTTQTMPPFSNSLNFKKKNVSESTSTRKNLPISCFPSSSSCSSAERLIKNIKKNILEQTKDFNLSIEFQKIRNLYISFDSGKMTSTLINLDIEEMTYCLAGVIIKYIELGEQLDSLDKENFPFDFRNLSMNTDLNEEEKAYLDYYMGSNKKNEDEKNFDLSDKFSLDQSKLLPPKKEEQQESYREDEEEEVEEEGEREIEMEEEDIDFEQSRKEIETILKESLLIKNNDSNSKNSIDPRSNCKDNIESTHNADHFESFNNLGVCSGDIKEDYRNFKQTYDYLEYRDESVEESKINPNNVSLLSKITRMDESNVNELSFSKDHRTIFDKAFNEKIIERWVTCKPTKEVISNFCKNIIITSKMEKEVTIICLIYLERLILKSKFSLTTINWRRVIFISLILASKLWDDESFENENFAQVFPQYTTKIIDDIEMVYLKFINFQLYIRSSEYAKYYFILRSFADKKKKSFPLKQLDLNSIIALQNNSSMAQKINKEIYANPLNKSF